MMGGMLGFDLAADAGLTVICIQTRNTKAFLKALRRGLVADPDLHACVLGVKSSTAIPSPVPIATCAMKSVPSTTSSQTSSTKKVRLIACALNARG
jgi:hypothetical protein